MDNQTTPEKTSSQLSKKMLAAITIICFIIGGASWYFLYFIKTPTYSLKLVKDSIETHDIAQFNKHIDLDSILSRGYDDLISAAIESDKNLSTQDQAFIRGFAQMFKSPAVDSAKDGIKRFIETGKWENDNKSQDAGVKQNQTSAAAEKLVNQSRLKKSVFREVAYTKKEGKSAVVGIKIFDEELNKEYILDIRMAVLDDGTWRATEISNFKEYIATCLSNQTSN